MNSQDAIDKLNTLGDTADKVAASLETLGIKGNPGMITACPIANYLFSCGAGRCSVGTVSVGVGDERSYLPDAVMQFISNFDHGKYQQLKG